MPDEVRMLDNRYALLFIRGENAVKDEKFDILKHPNVKLTTDGGAAAFVHGCTDHSIASITFADITDDEASELPELSDADIVIYSGEEIEEILRKEESE
jgi:type IV secretion system protein VirD4